MNYTILLDRNEDIGRFEAQEQSRFIYTVLESLNIPLEWDNPDMPFSVEQKQKFRKICADYSIKIIDDMNGGIQVFSSNDLIAQWNKCAYITKLEQDKATKKLYIEAHIDFWAKFEQKEAPIEENT